MAKMNFGGIAAQVVVDPASVTTSPVRVFPDPNLEAAVRTAVGVPVGDIHQSDLNAVTSFTANTLSIVDLTGMEYWITLTSLDFSYNSIVDISALASLTSLTELYLGYNSIVDISDLAGLTNLTVLAINDNLSIVDISALASLTSLTYLAINNNSIVNISALSSLILLTDLEAMDNNINNISYLVGVLSSGCTVYITNNPLNVHAYSTDIPALQLAGVTVDFDAEPTPGVDSILPASGSTAGGTPVTIGGSGFLDGATVTIDGNLCTDVVFVNSGSLTAVTPAGTAGAKDVVVTNDVQFGTLVEGFTYLGVYANSGGTITPDGDYTIHTFLLGQSGTNFVCGKAGNAAVLVVAGGGAGGGGGKSDGRPGGGGGGGGILYEASHAIVIGNYTVTVGDKGLGVYKNKGGNGGNSIFDDMTAAGGGGGGEGSTDTIGQDGGCGGGGHGLRLNHAAGTGSQGGNGGVGVEDGSAGGGGGAKPDNGNPGTLDVGGVGGEGYDSSITGASVKYAGGGGGGGEQWKAGGAGTDGGGDGAGYPSLMNPTAGATDKGGGGGGSGCTDTGTEVGANGGSGIVIIRCKTSDFS